MSEHEFLRHTLATLAYRCNKTLRDAPEGFAEFRTDEIKNTPLDVLAHIGDLLEWAYNQSQGDTRYHPSVPTDWQHEIERFHTTVQKYDAYLAKQETLNASWERLFQGPLADALTHVGQLALLRRMAGAPIQAENFFMANIKAGS